MKHGDEIIQEALNTYKPVMVLLLFSGGHDSMCSTHFAASYLKLKDIPFKVYHGDTTIYIERTRQYVKDQCKAYGWDLVIKSPPKIEDTYREVVRKHGFPGPNRQAHSFMYRKLKERALRHYITHEVKSSPYARENVLLISGARQSESAIRMGYQDYMKKENSKIWCSPLFYWHKINIENYMAGNQISRNPVKDKLGISGECLCGCFSDKGELDRLDQHFPDDADKIHELHELAIENGHPWPWAMGPNEWYKIHPPGQLSMDLGMCTRCHRIA
jgi:3'-phosphoadenosine 5'-phosphosulfate sulfotransferase (PAPS reductase)/FAD synthetase